MKASHKLHEQKALEKDERADFTPKNVSWDCFQVPDEQYIMAHLVSSNDGNVESLCNVFQPGSLLTNHLLPVKDSIIGVLCPYQGSNTIKNYQAHTMLNNI